MKEPSISRISKHIKGVLLDLDNTFYAYDPCHTYALKKCFEYFNRRIEKIGFKKFERLYLKGRAAVKKHNRATAGSRSRHLYFQLMLEEYQGRTNVEHSFTLGNMYWKTFLEKMALRPWVLKFLKDLKKRGIKIVVVTNLESSLQYRKLMRLGIANLIDYVVTSEEAGVEKPDPKIYAIALDKIRLRADDVVMVGDDPKVDGVGAKRASIPYIPCR